MEIDPDRTSFRHRPVVLASRAQLHHKQHETWRAAGTRHPTAETKSLPPVGLPSPVTVLAGWRLHNIDRTALHLTERVRVLPPRTGKRVSSSLSAPLHRDERVKYFVIILDCNPDRYDRLPG